MFNDVRFVDAGRLDRIEHDEHLEPYRQQQSVYDTFQTFFQ